MTATRSNKLITDEIDNIQLRLINSQGVKEKVQELR